MDNLVLSLDPNKVRVSSFGQRAFPIWESHPDRFSALVESISLRGQLQPGLVRELPNGDIELIAGRTRLEACKRLKRPFIAVKLDEDAVNDAVALTRMAYSENISRSDLTDVDMAYTAKALIDTGVPKSEVATELHVKGYRVGALLRLLDLTRNQQMLRQNDTISRGAAQVLLRYVPEDDRDRILTEAIKRKKPGFAINGRILFSIAQELLNDIKKWQGAKPSGHDCRQALIHWREKHPALDIVHRYMCGDFSAKSLHIRLGQLLSGNALDAEEEAKEAETKQEEAKAAMDAKSRSPLKRAAKPVAAKPVAAKPVAAKPVAAKPVAAKPVAAKPVAAKPVAALKIQAQKVSVAEADDAV